tara:strand:- start:4462 stop:4914 length:453 start_codon:yes stop_codon:yes gene_type:complete
MAVSDDMGSTESCRVTIGNGTLSVRAGLKQLLADPLLHTLSPQERASAEIVLAEVLNNVVEHAYARYDGETEITVNHGANGIYFSVTDHGLPFPGGNLPKGDLPDFGTDPGLPEGGFGWNLIRSLTRNLTYRRSGAQNRLRFQVVASELL